MWQKRNWKESKGIFLGIHWNRHTVCAKCKWTRRSCWDRAENSQISQSIWIASSQMNTRDGTRNGAPADFSSWVFRVLRCFFLSFHISLSLSCSLSCFNKRTDGLITNRKRTKWCENSLKMENIANNDWRHSNTSYAIFFVVDGVFVVVLMMWFVAASCKFDCASLHRWKSEKVGNITSAIHINIQRKCRLLMYGRKTIAVCVVY